MNLSLVRGILALPVLGLSSYTQVAPQGQGHSPGGAGYGPAAPGFDAQGPAEAGEVERPLVVEGTVLLPDGRPAAGAVVVSSAGGLASVRADGSFTLEVRVSSAVSALQLNAVANGSLGSPLTAQRLVPDIGDLDRVPSGPCS